MTAAPAALIYASWELACHGFRAHVEGPAPALVGLAERFPQLPDWAISPGDTTKAHFRVVPAPDCEGAYRIEKDCAAPSAPHSLLELPARLDRAIVTAALDAIGQRRLLFHAGAVASHGRGTILAAPSGSGKTTLVAALVRAGFRYLSDEVTIIDGAECSALPFARSLSLKPGTRKLLGSAWPRIAHARLYDHYGPEPVSFLPPAPEEWPDGPVTVERVVFPSYRSGGTTALVEIARSEALELLLAQAFNLRDHGAAGLAQTVALLRRAACFRLEVGDLDTATDLLRAGP